MTDYKAQMGKALKRLAGHRSNYEAWADFAIVGASELSAPLFPGNPIHDDARLAREKYDENELGAMAEMMGFTVLALEENPNQDFLGSMFMALEIGNKHNGQFFTPYSVCAAMAEGTITKEGCDKALAEKGYVTLNDPACGGGATLIAGANRLRELGVSYSDDAWFVGQDLNQETACMCYIQLALLGCAGEIVIGDTIRGEARQRIELPMNLISGWWTIRRLKGGAA
jgi:hypothetical protein